MRVTIERAALLKALNHVQSVVERRNTIPILSNVLVQANAGSIKLTATDLDVEVIETVAADVAQDGATTVPAHMLYDIVRKLPDGSQLEIEQGPDEGRLAIFTGRSRFSLQALPPADFPDLASGDMTHQFVMPAAQLKLLIDRTRFAISTEETRYYLNGIYLHDVTEDETSMIRAVATDGHRLAQAQLPCPEGAGGMPGIIVPRKTVLELIKLLEDVEDDVDVSLSSSKIRFSFCHTGADVETHRWHVSRLRAGHSAEQRQAHGGRYAYCLRRRWIGCRPSQAKRARAVKLNISGERVVLSVNNPDSGSAEEEIAVSFDGEPIDIGFNSRYLLDIAGQFKNDEATFMLADSGSPTVIRDAEDISTLYVLMPMRV